MSYCRYSESNVCAVCGHVAPVPGLMRECGKASAVRGLSPRAIGPRPPARQRVRTTEPQRAYSGPGSELKRLLARVGIRSSSGCSCNARARLMDERGVEWCEAHLDEITGWLREEATKRGLPFIDAAGRMLVRRAIKKARRAGLGRAS